MQEYIVRVPPKTNKKYHVMRFSASNNVDVGKWKSVKLDRESALRNSAMVEEEIPKFGAGSEFGREAREEARRRKYARYAKKPEDQPWILNVKGSKSSSSSTAAAGGGGGGSGKSSRKFKGQREGGVTDNTSYYVFFQAHDGAFEAYPISEWYNFTPIPRYKALTAEEAEERFESRDKILNFFSVMAKKNDPNSTSDSMLMGEEGVKTKKGRSFKVSDMDDWGDLGMSGGSDADSDSERTDKKNGSKKKGSKGKGKKKKKSESDEDDDDSEPQEESDEGDFDTREVDYMSDSSSDSDDDVERLNRELKGVEDEDALRKLVLSDEEDEEEEEENAEENKEQDKADPNTTTNVDAESTSIESSKNKSTKNEIDSQKLKVKKEKKDTGDVSSGSDSDGSDFDDTKYTSPMFMQKEAQSSSKGESKASTSTKRKLESAESSPAISTGGGSKKAKIVSENVVAEETVKRYLMRKPITTTELVQKFKSKKINLSGGELVSRIAEILKRLNPDKQTIKGKMYLYIKPK